MIGHIFDFNFFFFTAARGIKARFVTAPSQQNLTFECLVSADGEKEHRVLSASGMF